MSAFKVGTGTLSGLASALTINGGGSDVLNVNDTSNGGDQSATITGSAITGLDLPTGGINYTGLASVNLSVSGAGRNLTVSSTSATTKIIVPSGSAANTFSVGSGLFNFNGSLTIQGGGSDVLNLSDTSDSTAKPAR